MTKALVTINQEVLDPRHNDMENLPRADRGLLAFTFFGLFSLFILFGGFAYWALTTKLDGAVIASGSFTVESNRKTVQHLEGGIVRELLVKEGDIVEASQVLLRMDSTDSDVNIDVLGAQISELYIRRARLIAEINDAPVFAFDVNANDIVKGVEPSKIDDLIAVQAKVFTSQLEARKGEEDVVNQRIRRFKEEIEGLQKQREAGARQKAILEKDLVGFQILLKKELVAASRVNGILRELEQLTATDASLVTSQTRASNQIEELKFNKISQKRLRIEAVSTELADIETRISSLEPEYYGAKERQRRVAIVAPVSGKVVGMQVYTEGGVIRSGEPILDIVPQSDELVVEARVETQDIEKLRVGQDTRIRLTAFDATSIPEATGKLLDLSADAIRSENNDEEYYMARIKLDEVQAAEVSNLELIPGMPADVFFNTGERTAISYFLQPLNDRISRTFLE